MIPIRSIMKKDFSKLSSSESVGAVAKVMEKMDVDYLLIEEEDKIRGIVTPRELAGYPSSRLILDCVIQPIGAVREEALADEALRVLEQEKVGFLAVLNAEGIPIGLTNRQTIIDSLFQELEKLNREKDKHIIDLRQAKEALRVSKESFNNIVKRSADGIIVMDEEGKMQYLNPAAESIFQLKGVDLEAGLFGIPTVFGDDVAEVDIIRRNGEVGVAEMRITEIEWEGEFAYMATLHDITERKRVEQMEAEAQASKARVEQLEQELRSLERLSVPPGTGATAETFGLKPFRQASPDTFNQVVQHYGDLMDLALEQQAYKVEHDISGKLRTIAEELGSLKAGPRDVVEIHSSALRKKTSQASHTKVQAYAEEGRMMVLQLMGHLASYYRTYYPGAIAMGMNKKPVKVGKQ